MIEKHDKYYNFSGSFEDENLNKLIAFINENSGSIMINFGSNGGDIWNGSFAIKMLNENKERISICANGIYSTGFRVFYFFEGTRYLVDNSRGMYHYPYRSIEINDNGKPTYTEGDCIKKSLKNQSIKTHEFVNKFMNKEEIKKFKKGIDIYFDGARMKEIFPDAIII